MHVYQRENLIIYSSLFQKDIQTYNN